MQYGNIRIDKEKKYNIKNLVLNMDFAKLPLF